MTDFMEQKFGTAVTISERLIHTAYNNRLSPRALQNEALIEAFKYVNKIARNSDLLSFVHQPFQPFSGGNLLHLQTRQKNICIGAPCTTHHTAQPDAPLQIHSTAGPFQHFQQRLCHTRGRRVKHDCSWSLYPTNSFYPPIYSRATKWGRPIFAREGMST
jgi:hypothetical protein